MAANCYVITHIPTKDACLIDPGGEPARIMDVVKKNCLNLKFIINTHRNNIIGAAQQSINARPVAHGNNLNKAGF